MTRPRAPPSYAPLGAGIAAKEWESYVAAVYPGDVSNAQLIEVEADVLALLGSGLTRAAIAAQRGVTPPAITHTCKRLARKGYTLPAALGGPERPQPHPGPRRAAVQGRPDAARPGAEARHQLGPGL